MNAIRRFMGTMLAAAPLLMTGCGRARIRHSGLVLSWMARLSCGGHFADIRRESAVEPSR